MSGATEVMEARAEAPKQQYRSGSKPPLHGRSAATHTMCVIATVPASAAPTPNGSKSNRKKGTNHNNSKEPLTEARFDIPVTPTTRVMSLIREVAELVLPAALRDATVSPNRRSPGNGLPPIVHGAIFHNNEELPPDMLVSEIPKDATLYFYYGEELEQRNGKGCELRPYDARRPPNQVIQQQGVVYGKGNPTSSVYSGTTVSRGNGISEETSEARESSYYGANTINYPSEMPHGDRGRKASTAPTGNPWGMEDRGQTYRIPIRSTSEAPFHRSTSKPTTPVPPGSSSSQQFVSRSAPSPQQYYPHQQPPRQPSQQQGFGATPGTMMMIGPNGEQMPVMMMMPYFSSPGMAPPGMGYYDQSGAIVDRGKTVTPNHVGHPPSASASESKVSRSQRFFAGSQLSHEVTASEVSVPREAHSLSPVEVENTARKMYAEQSPAPVRPTPRKLNFEESSREGGEEVVVEERENHLVVTTNKRSDGVPPLSSGAINQQSSSSALSPEKQQYNREEEKAHQKEMSSKKTAHKGKQGKGKTGSTNVSLAAVPGSPHTVFSVVSNIEESVDYLHLNIELPEGVDPQLVCGLGDNSTNAVTIGRGAPEDAAATSVNSRRSSIRSPRRQLPGGFDPIRRLRVHRDTPVGTLRELLNVKKEYGIAVDDVLVHDEINTLAELKTKNEAVVTFVPRGLKSSRRRSTVIPPEFLTAMMAPPPAGEFEGEHIATITTKVGGNKAAPSPTSASKTKKGNMTKDATGTAAAAPKTPEKTPNHRPRQGITSSDHYTPLKEDQKGNSSKLISTSNSPEVKRRTERQLSSLNSASGFQVMTPERLNLQDLHQTPRESHTTSMNLLPPVASSHNTPNQKNRSGTRPPGTANNSINQSTLLRNGGKELSTSNIGAEGGRRSSKRGSSLLLPLDGGSSHRKRSSAANEPTIDVNELSSEDEEEESARMNGLMMVAASASKEADALRAAERRRSSAAVSRQVTTRRQRVKRTTTHALVVGTAEDEGDALNTELNDTLAEDHLVIKKQITTSTTSHHHSAGQRSSKKNTPPSLTLYTFKRRDSENMRQENAIEKMLITIQDPKDPNMFHRDVPVDQNCPVSILRGWLLRDDDKNTEKTNGVYDEAVANADIYYRGELLPPGNERLTFKAVTEFFPNGVFSFHPLAAA